MSKCYLNARRVIEDLTSHDPSPASLSFAAHGAQCDTHLISSLCATPEFFIEELLAATGNEAAGCSAMMEASSSDTLDLGAKRARAGEAAGSKMRGKK